jgi:hypothetical protein
MNASTDLREMIATLSTDQIKEIAVKAAHLATPVSAFTFGRCMEVLAARFDRRSFVNICEAIQAELA